MYLGQAGRLADTIAVLEKALDGADLLVAGYMGKGTVGNPLLAELRQSRMLLGQLVARINLNVPESSGALNVAPGNRHRAAALARWYPSENGGRRASNTAGLRQLLLDDYRRSLERWRIPGPVYEKEQALESTAAVEVSSAELMCALMMHAGLPYARFAFGGVDPEKMFLLTERNELVELPDDA